MIPTRTWRRAAVLLLLAPAALAAAAGPDVADTPVFRVTLRPLPAPDGRTIQALAIDATLGGIATTPAEPLVELPYVIYNVPTMAAAIEGLEARDDAGALALTARDSGDGDARRRQWFPDRAPQGNVHFGYRTPVATVLAPRGAAPPTELRAEADAVSGAASTFVLRPRNGTFRLGIDWDLAALPPGALAASSLDGVGDTLLPVSTLDMTFVMAGRIGRYQGSATAPFYGVWQGQPPFEAAPLMAWAAGLHAFQSRFFHARPAGYGIFMRRNPVNPGGGIGGFHSFVITYGEERGSDPEELKFTLAHEMFHTFQPMMGGADGEDLAYSWFNEGLAVYYQQALPYQAGMIDGAARLRNINYHAGRYYTNALGNAPNSEVPARFWQDTRIRTLPYDRGFLYFATVDEALRRVSRGRRSLDDLVVELRTDQERGAVLAPADWERVLHRELGARGVADFHAMLAGRTPLPGSAAFGPCLRRVARSLRRYELGFDPRVLTESPRVVRDLLAGSAAERAGLRNGDVITRPVGQDDIQGRQDGILTLQVERDGQPMTIAYPPRGATVSAWQWERVPAGVRGSCRDSKETRRP